MTKENFLFNISIPYGLSFLSFNDFNAYVPGVKDIFWKADILSPTVR